MYMCVSSLSFHLAAVIFLLLFRFSLRIFFFFFSHLLESACFLSHLHVPTQSGGEVGFSDSAIQRPLLLSILSMLLEGP